MDALCFRTRILNVNRHIAIMDGDEEEQEYTVRGKIIGYNFGSVFLEFAFDPEKHFFEEKPQYALVRSHRLFVDGRRVRPSEIKTVDKLGNVIAEHFSGKEVTAEVKQINRDGASYR